VAEALNHRADIYAAAGDQRAMQAARQRAFTTVTNTGAAPLLNYQQTAREAVALMREHVQAAEQGDYPKAQNDVLSLLILFKNQYRLSSADSAALRMNLSEAALLAHMGYYCQLQNHAQPARQFVALAQEAIPRETDSANKVLFRLILARHSRLIGQPRAMVGHIESAEQSLGIIADAPPELVLGIQEEKGLALFLLGFADQALTELEKAAELAKQSGSEKDRERLDYYILNLREKKLDAAIVTGHPRNLDAALRLLKRAQFGSEGPEIFRSPFAMDQPEGAPKSEAEALDKIALVRPVLKKISDNDYEVFMATRRWERAVPVIKEVIAEHGETTPRLLKLGECHFNLARWADAKAVYERILEIEPGNRRATEYLETVKLRLKN
jgi:tetratricopeptide (TPR) repeat protein